MSGAFVADSSVGVAWAVYAQASDETDALLDRIAAGSLVIVPSLWPYEIANSLLALYRWKRITQNDYRHAIAAMGHLPVTLDEEGLRLAMTTISNLAMKHGLSIYDATYLEVTICR